MIRFKNVTKRYNDGQEALHNVNFHLAKREMAFLTGHSGAGKSTILNIVALIERQTQGEVHVNGYDFRRLRKRQIPILRRSIGYVGQNPELLFDHSVFNNVALPLQVTGCDEKDIPRRVRAALDKVNLLSKEKMITSALSSGEQQRVAIARAIVNRPDLLLADEPTGNLDPDLAFEIMRLFRNFNDFGTSVLIATHDRALAQYFPCRQIQLQNGRLLTEEQHELV